MRTAYVTERPQVGDLGLEFLPLGGGKRLAVITCAMTPYAAVQSCARSSVHDGPLKCLSVAIRLAPTAG
jgi:hypothetical protein